MNSSIPGVQTSVMLVASSVKILMVYYVKHHLVLVTIHEGIGLIIGFTQHL